MKKAFLYGVLASFFFAFTFVLNRSMNLAGGHWLWSACLRYLFMLPMLALLLLRGRAWAPVLRAIRRRPWPWLLWSTVGFGLFYAPLTLASEFGESWLVAASWQLTIVAGTLLCPLFGKRIPLASLGACVVVLLGVFLLQFSGAGGLQPHRVAATLLPIVVAAVAYPLGNRKMMQIVPEGMSAVQRVFGMTLCSMPFWLVLSAVAFAQAGPPVAAQVAQSVAVALFSGVVATVLFFKATNMVQHSPPKLALVEATQAGEVVFTLLGGVLLLGDALPGPLGFAGLAVVVAGMVASSLAAAKEPAKSG